MNNLDYFYANVGGVVHKFESSEERDEFMALQDTCMFVNDKKCEHQDYWFCHCSECGYKTNTVLTEGNDERPGWNFCPSCGRPVER